MNQNQISYDEVISMLEEYCQEKPEAGVLHEKLVSLRNLVSKSENITDPIEQNEATEMIEQKIEEIEYLLDEMEADDDFECDDEDEDDFDDEDYEEDEDFDEEEDDEDYDFDDEDEDEDEDDEDEDYEDA
jgi:hypothetical protein